MFKLEGKLTSVQDVQTFASGFSKREFVIATEEKYPQMVKFELIKEDVSMIDSFQIGTPVEVGFYVRGNEYQGKYYVNLAAKDVKSKGAVAPSPAQATQQMYSAPQQQTAPQPTQQFAPPTGYAAPVTIANDSDLPF